MKHTPGPWSYQENSDAYTHIVRASGNEFICQLGQSTEGVEESNARLIAAAPDMYDVLTDILKTISPDLRAYEIKIVERVLAKARGEK